MQNLKRWTPLMVISGILVITLAYLFLNKQVVEYKPRTDHPAVIYREACQHCHGDKGQGTGLLYPGLVDEEMTLEAIEKIIQEGSFLMPAYIHIKGDTLRALSKYIYDRRFLPDPSANRDFPH